MWGGGGSALLGLERGQGERDGSWVGVTTGTKAHTGSVVGLLDRKAETCHMEEKESNSGSFHNLYTSPCQADATT